MEGLPAVLLAGLISDFSLIVLVCPPMADLPASGGFDPKFNG